MNTLRYIKPDSQDAAFHFAVEEYFMEQAPLSEPIFMIWQADQCAMLGAYQVAEAEIDLKYAKELGIQIVRRQSGGGTIFTDLGTLLYTLILPDADDLSTREILREQLAAPLLRALNKSGVPAKMEGRNDLLADGKKFSGLAQYARKGRVCTHGSLLFDTDLDILTNVLRVDDEKIRSKAIRSVRSRVTNLRDHMDTPVTISEFWTLLEQTLAEEWNLQAYTLTEVDLEKIDEIYRKKYNNPDWTLGSSPKFSFHNTKRFPAGKVEVFLDVAGGDITAVRIHGDFLGTHSMHDLEERLLGRTFHREAVAEALSGFDLLPYLGEVTAEQFLSCIFE